MDGVNLILAGPGTGKTTELVNRVVTMVKKKKAQKGIIICTFTRKATQEISERIYGKLSMQEVNEQNILIGTIHSICYELLLRYSNKDFSDYSIIPEDEQVHFVHSKLANFGLTGENLKRNAWTVAEELTQIFNKITDQEIDYRKIKTDDDDILDALNAYPLYRRILTRNQLFDFATIQATLLKEITTDNAFLQKIQDNFDYFFVDEYQDVNPIQHKVFKVLCNQEHNLTVVGDDDQCIYEFRGSDVSIIRAFKNEFESTGQPVKEKLLNVNYRSSNSIVNFTNNLLDVFSGSGIPKNITANRVAGSHKVVVNQFVQEEAEVDFIIRTIMRLKANKQIKSYNEIALLYRSIKNHAMPLIKGLAASHIPFQLFGAGDFFNKPIGREFMACVDFYLGKEVDQDAVFYGLLEEIDSSTGSDLASYYAENGLVDKLNELFNSKKYFSCIDLAYDIIKQTDMLERYEGIGPNIGIITQIVSSFDAFASSFDPYGLYSYLSYLKSSQKIDFDDSGEADAVQIMTIHQSKGLEFPVVFMPSQVERKSMTGITEKFDNLVGLQQGTSAEDFRVIYVAATRAEDLLVITGSQTLIGKRKFYKFNKYLDHYLAPNNLTTNAIDFNLLSNQQFRQKDRVATKNPTLSYNSIALYKLCPKAYMFSHVWHLETSRIGGMEFGQNIHAVIETIVKKVLHGEQLQDINVDDEVDLAWKKSITRSISEDEKFKTAAKAQIKGFVENAKDYLKQENIVSSEDTFNIALDGVLVTGRFDAVFKRSDLYVLVDFKTGDERDYTPQLSFYSICFKEKYGSELPLQLKVYFTKTARFEDITARPPEVEINDIKFVANEIASNHFNATPGKVCGQCAYNKICLDHLRNKKNP